MAKKIDGKLMVPGTLTKKKMQQNWFMSPTCLLFGEHALQGDQPWLYRVNLFLRKFHGYCSDVIPYNKMLRVEYCEGRRRKDTLKIIADSVNGTYYFCISEWGTSSLEKVKALLESCIEDGCFGARAMAIAQTLTEPLDKLNRAHLVVAMVSILLMYWIGNEVDVYLAIIPMLFAINNARASQYPMLKWIPVLMETVFFWMMMVRG